MSQSLAAAAELSLGSPPLPTVLLRHERPDGSQHIDWMIACDAAASRPLASFRLPVALHELIPHATVTAERIADHRPAYLHFEGALSDGRGHVARIAKGLVTAVRLAGGAQHQAWELAIRWENSLTASPGRVAEQILRLECHKTCSWRVFCISINQVHQAQ